MYLLMDMKHIELKYLLGVNRHHMVFHVAADINLFLGNVL
jgi:hypothetical protein